jgi:hypothetical protein
MTDEEIKQLVQDEIQNALKDRGTVRKLREAIEREQRQRVAQG